MIQRHSLLLVLATTFGLGAQEPGTTVRHGIAWQPDLAAAHRASAADHEPVIAYLTFDT